MADGLVEKSDDRNTESNKCDYKRAPCKRIKEGQGAHGREWSTAGYSSYNRDQFVAEGGAVLHG